MSVSNCDLELQKNPSHSVQFKRIGFRIKRVHALRNLSVITTFHGNTRVVTSIVLRETLNILLGTLKERK